MTEIQAYSFSVMNNNRNNIKNESPVVSVVMNCLNGEKYLKEAIDSVFAQTFKNWEIVFWDNNSIDASAEIAKGYGCKVKCFRSESTYTLGKARDLALQKTRGKYIGFLDVDDLWLPTKLEKQLALFKTNQKLGMVYSSVVIFDENGDQFVHSKNSKKRGYIFGDLLVRNFIGPLTILYKKSALESLSHIFDDQFIMLMDFDLSLRVAYNFEIDFVSDPLAKWRRHEGNFSFNNKFLSPIEHKRLLNKLSDELPGIEDEYKELLNIYKRNMCITMAHEEWSKSNNSEARNHLLPYLRVPMVLFIYCCTWTMNYSFYVKIKSGHIKKLLHYLRR